MSAHTPGPWFVTEQGGWPIVVDARSGIVANVNPETGPDTTSVPAMRRMPCVANAALIAKAPEMLAALVEAHDFFAFHVDGRPTAASATKVNQGDINRLCALLAAAIAQTKGGES